MGVTRLYGAQADPWGAIAAIAPLRRTYESNFFHHNFYNSENNIRGIGPILRPLFSPSSVAKYASQLLQ